MFRRGRFIVFFSILMAVNASSCTAAGGRGSPSAYRQSQAEVQPTERTIAAKRTKDLVITITNREGKLRGGDNDVCVLFEKRETREPVDVENVEIDFVELVGRVQEKAIKTQLQREETGRYCGHIDLGKRYRVPTNYYAFVRYVDSARKKRRLRFFMSAK